MASLGSFLLVSDIRGKLGGSVYARSRSGAVLRIKAGVRNPNTRGQLAARTLFANGAKFARSLDPGDVGNWKAYAESLTFTQHVSGASYHPSWINALCQVYVPFFTATPTGTFSVTPPAAPFTGDVITLSAAMVAGQIVVTGDGAQSAGMTTFIYAKRLRTQNTTPSGLQGVLQSSIPIPGSPFQITLENLLDGFYQVQFRWVSLSTGQQTGLQILGVFEVAA